ncbi:MAG TPA: ATP-binding protein [Acidimicrobiales bacterium]|nr:ATP-binding protein [Acidimicrobiales bacterium]
MKRSLRGPLFTAALTAVIAALSMAGFFFFKASGNQQETTLLKSDASQAGLYVGSVLGQVGEPLDTLATAMSLSHSSATIFAAQAGPLAKSGLTMALAVRRGASYVVELAAGSGYSAGQTLSPAVSAALAAAGSTLTPGPVVFNGRTSTALFAVGPPLSPAGTALFLQFSLDPSIASPVTAAKPFALLKVALYGGPKPARSDLLVATVPLNQLPLGRGSLTDLVSIGNAKWALVAVERSPLVGSFARRAPYIILVLGLFIAVLVGVALEIFERRQRYAAALVEERTADLQTALAELRQAQDSLVRTERLSALGEMASVVGHELRNPLAAVINALYLLRRQLGEPAAPQFEKHLAMAERETGKAAAMAEDLTAFVRPREPKKEKVDVPELVREVVETTPPPKAVSVVVDVGALMVDADRRQLSEVLNNLVTNAYQAVPDGGSVRIAARHNDGAVDLSVEDSGPGIDADVANRVFEPFFTTKHDGTGLGLAIVQRLVEAHGGTVVIDGPAASGGARVVVRLPVSTSAGDA